MRGSGCCQSCRLEHPGIKLSKDESCRMKVEIVGRELHWGKDGRMSNSHVACGELCVTRTRSTKKWLKNQVQIWVSTWGFSEEPGTCSYYLEDVSGVNIRSQLEQRTNKSLKAVCSWRQYKESVIPRVSGFFTVLGFDSSWGLAKESALLTRWHSWETTSRTLALWTAKTMPLEVKYRYC